MTYLKAVGTGLSVVIGGALGVVLTLVLWFGVFALLDILGAPPPNTW